MRKKKRPARATGALAAAVKERKEALAQYAATAEILSAMSRSPGDAQLVFQAIVDKAHRLCGAAYSVLYRYDGQHFGVIASSDLGAKVTRDLHTRAPLKPDRSKIVGRALLEAKTLHTADVNRDMRFPATAPIVPRRAVVAVPLVRDGAVLGAISCGRVEARDFTRREIQLLETFADEAVIAMENARLFDDTKRALERQTATGEILASISSSMDSAQPVFDAIVRNLRRLFSTAYSAVFLARDGKVDIAAADGEERFVAGIRAAYPLPLEDEEILAARAIRRAAVMRICPIVGNPEAPAKTERLARVSGYNSIMIAPMLRDGVAIGAVATARTEALPFDEPQVALIKSFAAQAVIAIENARLFNETKEALEQQTATAEILRVISSSPSDMQPVFDSILEHAMRLCDAGLGTVGLYDGKTYRHRAQRGGSPEYVQRLFDEPFVPHADGTLGRMIAGGRPVHIPDYRELRAYREREPRAVATVELGGARTYLAVPMLKDGRVLGGITIRRAEVRPFTQKQIDLVSTFANQAVIAIENVRLFKEIQEKSALLEVANRHKSEFLANMSHELRTPLNAIIGFSEVLTERMFGEVNEKQLEYLKDIHESGRHLLSLINDILDLSKIEAGRMELELSTFHLPSALSNAMTLVRERAQRHGIHLGLEVDEQLAEFSGDERKFKQIMLNLLSNAVKFTPDGGKVDVRARKSNGGVEVAVRDTGIGIAPEDQVLVFEEFRQVGRDRMRKAEGTGLGLALTKRFVELHGGAIRLESTPGSGSTFSFTLPVR